MKYCDMAPQVQVPCPCYPPVMPATLRRDVAEQVAKPALRLMHPIFECPVWRGQGWPMASRGCKPLLGLRQITEEWEHGAITASIGVLRRLRHGQVKKCWDSYSEPYICQDLPAWRPKAAQQGFYAVCGSGHSSGGGSGQAGALGGELRIQGLLYGVAL